MRVEGKLALVTGASSGIGRAAAIELASRGADVIVVARRTEPLETLQKEIEELGQRCHVITADLSSEPGCNQAASEGLEIGRIDILVNNAGFAIFDDVATARNEDLELMMMTNYFGALRMSRALLPPMIARGNGAIVNVASIAGMMGFFRMGGYCASKFALVGLSESMRNEVYRSGVRVSLVCPGTVETEFFQLAEKGKMPAASRLVLAIPPQRVAKAIVRAVERGSYRIVVPWSAAVFMKFKELFPRTAHFMMRNVSAAIERKKN